MDERPDTGRDALPGDLETVRPAALGPTTLSHTLSYDHDLAPFVRLAFPQPVE